jgi:internalin A
LYIETDNNPCFNGYDVKFEINKNHYDLVLNLLKKIDEEKKEYILPTKVLLLGNSGCGKSTLLDYILQNFNSKVFKNDLDTTHIIQIETYPKKLKRNTIPKAVFYDFGGQDYYHGLYKAFLSNDSLNVLFWSNQNDKNQIRKDRNDQLTRDYDRNYWLYQLKFQYEKKNNEKLVEKSEPIILVQTHADEDDSRRITYRDDSNSFNIINEFYLSFSSVAIKKNKTLDIGLRYFEETLEEHIKQKQIKKNEPIWYRNFLNYILKSKAKTYIKLSDLKVEYKRDSDKNNYLLPEVLREIAQTGLILYYKDDEDLKDVVWLNPTGIIEDIHDRVLSKESIKKNKGVVDKELFDKLIKDDKLIKLLINQKVLFLDKHDNKYIIPGYLPLTEEEDKLYELLTFDFIEPNFVMKFEHFIPFGLINQLVCFYGKGKTKKHYWRDQLLFTKGNTKILIKLDFTNLEILVSIKSKDNSNKLENIQQEIFTDILDIYWDKNNKFKSIDLIEPKFYKFESFVEKSTQKKMDLDIKIDKLNERNLRTNIYYEFKDPLKSPEDLYISIDNKYFINHKDLEDKEKTFNKIMSFGVEIKKEIQNNKEIEIRRIDRTKFSEKASGLYRSFTTNKNAENMKRIFISYAKENKKEVNEFQKQIAPFKLTKEVETWHCSELQLGEDWDSKIKNKFYEADIILYFISVDFFSTPFILDEEVRRGIERDNDPNDNVVLIPIILEKIHWEDLLGKYSSNFKGKAINSYEKSNNAWYEIIDDLKKHHFRKIDSNSTSGILGQSKEKMKAQEDTISGKL